MFTFSHGWYEKFRLRYPKIFEEMKKKREASKKRKY
jgi:hypothetical protein